MQDIDEITKLFRGISKNRRTGQLEFASGHKVYFYNGKLAYCLGEGSEERLKFRAGEEINLEEELSEEALVALEAETSYNLCRISGHSVFQPGSNFKFDRTSSPLSAVLDIVELNEELEAKPEILELLNKQGLFTSSEDLGCKEPFEISRLREITTLTQLELVKRLNKAEVKPSAKSNDSTTREVSAPEEEVQAKSENIQQVEPETKQAEPEREKQVKLKANPERRVRPKKPEPAQPEDEVVVVEQEEKTMMLLLLLFLPVLLTIMVFYFNSAVNWLVK